LFWSQRKGQAIDRPSLPGYRKGHEKYSVEATAGTTFDPGIVAVIETVGEPINFHLHLHFLITGRRGG